MSNEKILSVTQVTQHIKDLIGLDEGLRDIHIQGEISNFSPSKSGHIYFTLKDRDCAISCVMFRSWASYLKFRPKDGDKVIVRGEVYVYPAMGKYQINVISVEHSGTGDLNEQYELLKKKLQAEGLFEDIHKLQIPRYITKLGIITSATGEAIHDILTVSGRRNPHIKRYLYPSAVQGKDAVNDIIKGISVMERLQPDVIIIARGGGSKEDLWQFNDERLAYAVYNCTIPIISGVGHAEDWTIIDYVADLRAATPSEAAEKAVYDYNNLLGRFVDYKSSFYHALYGQLENNRLRLNYYKSLLATRNPASMAANYRNQLNNIQLQFKSKLQNRIINSRNLASQYENRLKVNMNTALNNAHNKLSVYSAKLDSLSPMSSLARGYSYVTDQNGHNIKSVTRIKNNDSIHLTLVDGTVSAVVTDTKKEK